VRDLLCAGRETSETLGAFLWWFVYAVGSDTHRGITYYC